MKKQEKMEFKSRTMVNDPVHGLSYQIRVPMVAFLRWYNAVYASNCAPKFVIKSYMQGYIYDAHEYKPWIGFDKVANLLSNDGEIALGVIFPNGYKLNKNEHPYFRDSDSRMWPATSSDYYTCLMQNDKFYPLPDCIF